MPGILQNKTHDMSQHLRCGTFRACGTQGAISAGLWFYVRAAQSHVALSRRFLRRVWDSETGLLLNASNIAFTSKVL